jgi:excisionase family DNA binding protein
MVTIKRKEMVKVDNGFLTIGEVAERLKVSPSWIYKKCKAGIIPHVRIGGMVRFVDRDVDAWVNAHKVKGCLKV